MNQLLDQAWAKNKVLIGTWLKIPSLFTIEATVQAGFDFLVVDNEHSYMSDEWVYQATAIGQAHGVAVLIRAAEPSGRGISRLLDLDIDGVIFPQIYSASDARQAIASTIFQPRGKRGVGVTSRAGKWAAINQDEYMERSEQNLFRCIQFETESSFADLDEILEIEGLSSTFLGPSDLSQALGIKMTDPMISVLGRNLVAKSHAKGIKCGTALGNVSQIAQAIDIGYDYVMISNDTSLYSAAVRNLTHEADLARNAKVS
jgi:2-keto-3-deoxy-L-rhamnonate aldolase RhmA